MLTIRLSSSLRPLAVISMKNRYIRLNFQDAHVDRIDSNKVRDRAWGFVGKILSYFIPKANPDFDRLIDDVETWLIELNEEGIPEREIGFNSNGVPIMKMPWNKNYGYWTDNNLTADDFENLFEVKETNQVYFENYWNNYGGLGFKRLTIDAYKIQETGADGGHKYLISSFEHERKQQKVVIYFDKKADEESLKLDQTLTIEGVLFNDGNDSFSLHSSVLIEMKEKQLPTKA